MLLKMYTQIGAALCLLPKTPECPSWQTMIIPALVSLQLAETVPSLLTNSCKSRDFHPVCRRAKVLFQLFIVEAGARESLSSWSPLYLFLGDNLGLIFSPLLKK